MPEVTLEELDQEDFEVKDAPMVEDEGAFLSAVEVEIAVNVGSFRMSLEELLALRGGQIVTLEEQVGDPVSLTHEGKTLATGTLVAEQGKLAVKLDEE
ncbi:MAG: FliM/FliN family flagellar motor C-terminal domain-containing protein [Pseudomonadota bacterium]